MPEGIQDHKLLETASVDSSEAIRETCVPCATPKSEGLPQVEESPSDLFWEFFKEEIHADYPAQHSPSEGFIPQTFDKDFNTVLYSLCEDYQSWVEETADVMQKEEPLKEKVPMKHNAYVYLLACPPNSITLCVNKA